MAVTPLASVIIPTYGRCEYLQDAVQSVQAQNIEAPYEILVIDNAPSRAAERALAEIGNRGERAIHYLCESRIGLHHARHSGARAARGEVLVYIDDDVLAPPTWLKALLQPFEDPQVACAGGKTVPRWEGTVPPWLDELPQSFLSLLDLGESEQQLQWPDGVFGCNMAVRRAVLYEVGGFHPDGIADPRLIWYRGDGETGLHKKIYQAGYKVIYTPKAWLHHRIPASRLRPEAICRRAFLQGISDSYSDIREQPSRSRMLKQAASCFLQAARDRWRSRGSERERIRLRAGASYWLGRAQHQLRVAAMPKLYQHVLQRSYL